jgi:hypothetical protein
LVFDSKLSDERGAVYTDLVHGTKRRFRYVEGREGGGGAGDAGGGFAWEWVKDE